MCFKLAVISGLFVNNTFFDSTAAELSFFEQNIQ